VVTAADRVAACRLAEREAGVDLLILDDGFQHRRLARDLDLVLLAVGDRDARLLPRGPLREPASALRRADIIVENAGGESGPMVSRRAVGLVDRVSIDAEPGSLERLRGQRVVVICGIASPAAFVDMLVSCAASVEEVYAFADHHDYEPGDLDPLRAAQRSGALLLTTEKDLVKLEVFVDEGFSPLALRLGLEVEGGPALLDAVVDALDLKERGPHHQRSGAPQGDAGINK
jgi:tetraacyldisaccharide 4'-kinase